MFGLGFAHHWPTAKSPLPYIPVCNWTRHFDASVTSLVDSLSARSDHVMRSRACVDVTSSEQTQQQLPLLHEASRCVITTCVVPITRALSICRWRVWNLGFVYCFISALKLARYFFSHVSYVRGNRSRNKFHSVRFTCMRLIFLCLYST